MLPLRWTPPSRRTPPRHLPRHPDRRSRAADLNALYARFAPRVFSLTFRDETTPKRDLWAGAGEDTLRGLALGKLQADYDNAPG